MSKEIEAEAALENDGKALMSMGAPLYALIAAIKRSPIVVRLSERLLLARDWASVRKSPDVDAYVLAWIASHVRGPRRPPRTFMRILPVAVRPA
jgi:hypothetical protein